MTLALATAMSESETTLDWLILVLAATMFVTAIAGRRTPGFWGALVGSVWVRLLMFILGIALIAVALFDAIPLLQHFFDILLSWLRLIFERWLS